MLKSIFKWAMFGVILLIIMGVIISYMSPQTWFYESPSFTGTELEKASTPGSFSTEKLNQITDFLEESSATTSMVVLESGKIVYEYGDISEISYIASCRKSVLAILYGKYVEDSTINLEEAIGELGIDEDDGLLPIEKEATVDHIITSRSGVFHLPANGGYDVDNIKKRGSVKPGAYFVYNNWDFNVAGHILELKSGNSVYEELEAQLAKPLGFQDWNILNQKRTVNEAKSRYSAYHIHISTRDMAKIGQLMLQKGQWEGKQLISEAWIQKITTTVTPVDTVNQRDGIDSTHEVQFSYGYMWWLFEALYDNSDFEGAYTASGYAGQYITVIPRRNVVIAHKTTMDLLTLMGRSNRTFTPSWKYWEILRDLMEK
jgi:CubicO group peptidase (beta-lactamase class C family)